MKSNPIQVQNNFSKLSKKLREHFEARFKDPKNAEANRFVWDYWNVPGQYRLLRTPAAEFFPKALWNEFEKELRAHGTQTLGCLDLSPTWLSVYIEGCEQKMHADVPHGPWAYVYSLSKGYQKTFQGGETFVLKPSTLSYWKNFSLSTGLEREHLVEEVAPLFNRLTVFDPKLPHGVNRVSGAADLLEARVVLHGWFTKPSPYCEGPLALKDVLARLGDFFENLSQFVTELEIVGSCCVKIAIDKGGRVKSTLCMTNSLYAVDGDSEKTKVLLNAVLSETKKIPFPKSKGASTLTLPLFFETG